MTEEQLAMFNNLTKLQQNVALEKIANPLISNVEAYKRGGGTAKKNANAIAASASEVLNNPNVVTFVKSFNAERVQSTVMDRDEMIERLTKMARTEITDVVKIVNSDDQLMNMETGEVVEGQSFWSLRSPEEMQNGGVSAISELTATSQGLKIKLHDQRAAMKQLAELQGFDAPRKTELTGANGGPIQTVSISDEEFAKQLAELGLNDD